MLYVPACMLMHCNSRVFTIWPCFSPTQEADAAQTVVDRWRVAEYEAAIAARSEPAGAPLVMHQGALSRNVYLLRFTRSKAGFGQAQYLDMLMMCRACAQHSQMCGCSQSRG